MFVEIDPSAGFCSGVKKAVQHAESGISDQGSLLCLGDIVHNEEEIIRLENLGLNTISEATFHNLKDATVLIRAHGEPPETYQHAKANNIQLIEATCPIVLNLQKRINKATLEMEAVNGTVLIAGKKGHPEMIGLSGQTKHTAIVIESCSDIGKINFNRPIRLFAQTTFNKKEFAAIVEEIQIRSAESPENTGDFKSFDTICRQVSDRIPALISFCQKHDVIIFVSGTSSSNGKSLFEVCKTNNTKSYHISSPNELMSHWVKNAQSVGISGATSTPYWLMEQVANELSK